jgi:hypothetical protein
MDDNLMPARAVPPGRVAGVPGRGRAQGVDSCVIASSFVRSTRSPSA